MAHKIRKCIVDLTEYKYCPSCGDNPDETWRFIYCSENCRGIDKVLQGVVSGRLTELEAQEELKNYTVNINKMCKSTKNLLEKIYSVKPENKEGLETVVETEDVAVVKDAVTEEAKESVDTTEMITKSRGKRRKLAIIEEKD